MGLSFGYNQGLPEGIGRAWGARAIVNQQGMVDLVYNRQDWIGEPGETQALQDWLNEGGAIKAARERATAMLKGYEIQTNQACEVVLYEDGTGVIKANTNASHGYLYICAYLRADEARTPGGTEVVPGLTVREVSDEELAAASPEYREALEKRGQS